MDRIGNFPAGSGERPAWLAPLLAVAILGIGWGATAWLRPSQAIPLPGWHFPVELSTRPAPLTAGERDAWNRLHPEAIDRRWFSYTPQGSDHVVNGSMILVVSQDWQAQHRPENCFTVYGLDPVDSFTYLLRPGFPLRVLLLTRITDQRLLAAVYWFQSAAMTTDDYSTRVWADLLPQRQRWVMVTVLFGEPLGAGEQYDPGAAEFRGLYDAIHAAVQEGLEQETTFFDRE